MNHWLNCESVVLLKDRPSQQLGAPVATMTDHPHAGIGSGRLLDA